MGSLKGLILGLLRRGIKGRGKLELHGREIGVLSCLLFSFISIFLDSVGYVVVISDPVRVSGIGISRI